MAYPSDFKYTKEHEWIKSDGKAATIGITHYAQESLGDIVFVDLPKPGTEIAAGKTLHQYLSILDFLLPSSLASTLPVSHSS